MLDLEPHAVAPCSESENGFIRFYDAATGKKSHEILVGTGIVAPPISYAVANEHYIAVAAGWNGVKTAPETKQTQAPYDNAGRLIVLKLGGGTVRVAERRPVPAFYSDDTPQPAARVAAGAALYFSHCAICHGVAGEPGVIPDLRRMSTGSYAAFDFNGSWIDDLIPSYPIPNGSDQLGILRG